MPVANFPANDSLAKKWQCKLFPLHNESTLKALFPGIQEGKTVKLNLNLFIQLFSHNLNDKRVC